MGIVNVTPDSFYDGGRYFRTEDAVAHALALVEEGADLLDIGAESTRPGARPISEQEEIDRLIPVVREVARRVSIPISVDTTKAGVAQLAIEAGAVIINDVSALRFDVRMADLAAASGAAVVLMHMQGTPATMQHAPEYGDVVAEITSFFSERIRAATNAGISENALVLDPGIGFGKLQAHNLEILARLSAFAMLNRPLLVGLSRKAFIGRIIGRPVEERAWGTAAAVALAVDRGAHILRVHDVAMMADAVKVASAMKRSAGWPPGQDHYA